MGTLTISADKTVARALTGDARLDIALGLLNGVSDVPIVTGVNTAVGVDFADVWDEGGLFSFPTSGESWEVLSDNVNDTSTGTGMRTLEVRSLDDDFVVQTTTVILNGTTPVTVSGTHFRTSQMTGLTSGSNETNVGNITMRVSGGGDVRQKIRDDQGSSFSSFYTSPAGKTAFIYQTFCDVPKGEDTKLRSRIRRNLIDPNQITGGPLAIYENSILFPLDVLGVLPEKTDFWIQARSTNPSVGVTVSFQVREIDSDLLPVTTSAQPQLGFI